MGTELEHLLTEWISESDALFLYLLLQQNGELVCVQRHHSLGYPLYWEVPGGDMVGDSPSEVSLPGLQVAVFLLHLLTAFPRCIGVPGVSLCPNLLFLQEYHHTGVGPP
jgi:hypothetical protein